MAPARFEGLGAGYQQPLPETIAKSIPELDPKWVIHPWWLPAIRFLRFLVVFSIQPTSDSVLAGHQLGLTFHAIKKGWSNPPSRVFFRLEPRSRPDVCLFGFPGPQAMAMASNPRPWTSSPPQALGPWRFLFGSIA